MQQPKIYDWKRFWYPQGTQIKVCDRGYLIDPTSEWGKRANPELVGLDELADIPCLVLLGEPGIGKSQEIKNLEKHTRKLIDQEKGLGFPEEDKTLLLDLEDCNEGNLHSNLFKSKIFFNWVNGSHRLYLFLDSIDQGWLNIKKLPTLIFNEFKRIDKQHDGPEFKSNAFYLYLAIKTGFFSKFIKIKNRPNLSRLYLRLTCRSSIFSQGIEEQFQNLWNNDLQIYNLAPLCQNDIEKALDRNGLNINQCLNEIERKRCIEFSTRPITLEFLLVELQRNNGQLYESRNLSDIYLDGCRKLCKDPKDLKYHPLRPLSKVKVEKRLETASLIAAVTILCQKAAILTECSIANLSDSDDISISDFYIQYQNINELVIKEVLDTALFNSDIPNRMRWAHQSYAEFLAAWYLKKHDLEVLQLRQLLFHAGRVIPQLIEVVKWLASMRKDFLKTVIETDVDILIQGDLSNTDFDTKSKMVEAFLELHEDGKTVYRENFTYYRTLTHPGLQNQLILHVADSFKNIQSRYVAIDIAEACNLVTIASDLAKMALDTNQPYRVRERAARFVVNTHNKLAHEQLIDLVTCEQDDPEDDLKGYGLKATYPQYIETEEVLAHLTPPKASYFGGCYQEFLAHDFIQRLPVEDLALILSWFAKQEVTRDSNSYPFNALISELALKAWENLEGPNIATELAQMLVPRLRQYIKIADSYQEEIWEKYLEEDDNKRRLLLDSIVSIIQDSEKDPLWLSNRSRYSDFYLLKKDFGWLIEKLKSSTQKKSQKIYAQLISYYLDLNDVQQINDSILACDEVPVLRNVLSRWVEPIILDSQRAKDLKEQYLKLKQYEANQGRKFVLEHPPKTRVLQCLESFEAGHLDSWWRLCQEMTLLPSSQRYIENWKTDLTALPGWKDAEEQTKSRIISAAKCYIQNGDPKTETWLGTNRFPYSALSGYKALRLVLDKDVDFFSKVSAEVWRKWTAITLDYPAAGNDKNIDARQQLIQNAYQYAPDEFIRVLLKLIEKENTEHGRITIIKELQYCWDKKLEVALLNKLNDAELTSRSLGDLLAILLEHQADEAVSFAKFLLSFCLTDDDKSKKKAITAAQALIMYTGDATWPTVWQFIQTYPDIGIKILKSVSFPLKFEGSLEQHLSENHIAELYIFMIRQFPDPPPEEKSNVKGVLRKSTDRLITPEDSLRMWRERIPAQLQQLGTPEACQALRKIIDELPEQKEKIQWRLAEAEALARRKTWIPLTPQQLFQLIQVQEPTKLDLSKQLDELNQRTIKMEKEPKIDKSTNIELKEGSNFQGILNTGDNNKNTIANEPNDSPPNSKTTFDWKYWLMTAITLSGVIATVIGVLIAFGFFNSESKNTLPTPSSSPSSEQETTE